MEVSMDGLRKRLIFSYNSLTKKLNRSIENDEIRIDCYNIQAEMDEIKMAIVTLAFCSLEGSFSSLDDETHFETFNYSEED